VNRINPKYIPLAATALVMIALYVLGCLLYPNFGSLRVVVNLFGDSAFLGIAAVGATFVILSGGIDLSVGAVIAFIGIFVASVISAGVPPVVAMAFALLIGTAFGAAQGSLIRFFDLPPFLVTLGGMFLMRGLAFVVREESLAIKHAFYRQTIRELAIPLAPRVSFPFTASCFIAVVIAATYVCVFTRFGRNVYAIGSNENSASLMGVPVGATKIGIYALAGFFSALGGCVATFYMQSGNPASFVGLELDAIAAVVIGGTLLTGGVGFVPGTLMGVLILGLIQTLITFQGNLNTWWTKIAVGLLLLLFIVLQKAIGRTRAAHG
jgi:ribose/xylose/arabinose/galactoside ABC-type transport system permease subunit